MNEPSDERGHAYQAPRALLLGSARPSAGACEVQGNGDDRICADGSGATDMGCTVGNEAINQCIFSVNGVPGTCEYTGVGASDCLLQGSGTIWGTRGSELAVRKDTVNHPCVQRVPVCADPLTRRESSPSCQARPCAEWCGLSFPCPPPHE